MFGNFLRTARSRPVSFIALFEHILVAVASLYKKCTVLVATFDFPSNSIFIFSSSLYLYISASLYLFFSHSLSLPLFDLCRRIPSICDIDIYIPSLNPA